MAHGIGKWVLRWVRRRRKVYRAKRPSPQATNLANVTNLRGMSLTDSRTRVAQATCVPKQRLAFSQILVTQMGEKIFIFPIDPHSGNMV